MALYLRGDTYWYRFRFRGIVYRESTKSSNKEIAGRLEREHRRKVELGQQGLEDFKKPLMFKAACKSYIEAEEIHWSKKYRESQDSSLLHLEPFFGKMLLTDINATVINRYQRSRLSEVPKPSNRTVNIELSLVRRVLRKNKLWAMMQDEVKMLRERKDVGRELQDAEVVRLLQACLESTSKALYTAVVVSIHTGLRLQELRLLKWHQVDLQEGEIIVGKSKTEGGEGRKVYLSDTALVILKDWRQKLAAGAGKSLYPHYYVFPTQRYGLMGKLGTFGGVVAPYRTHFDKPTGSFNTAWKSAKKKAGVECRWHDMRHTCASRLAAGGALDTTLTSLLGWMSPKMLERYSHVRETAKRVAVQSAFPTESIQVQ